MALLVSAVMVMPWQEPAGLGICLGVSGAAGVVYSIRVVWHARKANYTPDAADWLWYTALPIVAHLTLVVGAGLLWRRLTWSLFTIGGDVLFFLFLGIHNSWDAVTYIALKAGKESRGDDGKNVEAAKRREDTK